MKILWSIISLAALALTLLATIKGDVAMAQLGLLFAIFARISEITTN